jgi:hypothetical protein
MTMEVRVTIDFACCSCEQTIGVTLKCQGKGLHSGSRTVASVNVPCPTCSSINQLFFEPNGTLRGVSPYRGSPRSLEPSIN